MTVSYTHLDVYKRQGLTFAGMVLLQRGASIWLRQLSLRRESQLDRLIGRDATPCFTTDSMGLIQYQNLAAKARFSVNDGATLIVALTDHFASPSAVLFRLQSRAANQGAAREDVVTRKGHLRLSVHRLMDNRFLWRLEEFVDRSIAGRGADSLSLPMLTANKAGVILFSNEAMRLSLIHI